MSTWTESANGGGTQTITAADPLKSVEYRINVASIGLIINGKLALAPEGSGTRVTWSDTFDLSGSYAMRYFGPMMGGQTEKMIDQSLETLKKRIESP